MKTIKVSLFIAAIIIAIGQSANAQKTAWLLLKQTKGVNVYYHKDVCMGKDVLTLQIENTSDKQVDVSWSLWGDGIFRKIQLKGHEKKIGECNSTPAGMLNEVIPTTKSINDVVPVVNVN